MEVRAFELPLAEALETGAGRIESRSGWLVRVAGEPAGIGEATPLPGWTEPKSATHEGLERADRALRTDGPTAALRAVDDAPAARHAVDLALADRDARAAGVPLHRYLSGEDSPRTIPVNATLGVDSIHATRERARTAVAAGFSCLKVKVGTDAPEADARRVDAAAEAAGAEVAIRADANGQWSTDQTTTFLDALDTALEYLEQPLTATDLAGHATLRDRVSIALDESLISTSVESIQSARAADILVLKPMVQGGLDRSLTIARRAAAAGVDVVVTTTFDAVIARTAAVHLAAAIDSTRHCGLATADRLTTDLADDPAPVADGKISVPTGPGIGFSDAWGAL